MCSPIQALNPLIIQFRDEAQKWIIIIYTVENGNCKVVLMVRLMEEGSPPKTWRCIQ